MIFIHRRIAVYVFISIRPLASYMHYSRNIHQSMEQETRFLCAFGRTTHMKIPMAKYVEHVKENGKKLTRGERNEMKSGKKIRKYIEVVTFPKRCVSFLSSTGFQFSVISSMWSIWKFITFNKTRWERERKRKWKRNIEKKNKRTRLKLISSFTNHFSFSNQSHCFQFMY